MRFFFILVSFTIIWGFFYVFHALRIAFCWKSVHSFWGDCSLPLSSLYCGTMAYMFIYLYIILSLLFSDHQWSSLISSCKSIVLCCLVCGRHWIAWMGPEILFDNKLLILSFIYIIWYIRISRVAWWLSLHADDSMGDICIHGHMQSLAAQFSDNKVISISSIMHIADH